MLQIKKRRLLLFGTGIALAILICFLSSIYGLEVTNYVLTSPKIEQSIRIAQITDLHNSEFGPDNARLIRLVQKQRPDLIVITGDMLNGFEEQTDTTAEVTRQLAQIAPTYVSYGNHETTHRIWYFTDIRALYEQAGATVLEREYADIEVNGQPVRIGGLLGYCLSERYLETGEAVQGEIDFLREVEDTPNLKLLLCHYPLCWLKNDNLEVWDIDCVFTGHVHGGQIRFPFIGGLYAPDQGMFPGRLSGLYRSQDRERVMVLSRGLGGRSRFPRVNNVPEIVVVDILPEKE